MELKVFNLILVSELRLQPAGGCEDCDNRSMWQVPAGPRAEDTDMEIQLLCEVNYWMFSNQIFRNLNILHEQMNSVQIFVSIDVDYGWNFTEYLVVILSGVKTWVTPVSSAELTSPGNPCKGGNQISWTTWNGLNWDPFIQKDLY